MSRHSVPLNWPTVTSALACGLFAAIGVASAQSASQPAPQAPAKAAAAAKPDPAAAQRAIESGIASYNAGKADLAVQQLSTALSGGKLPAPQMARALYYRGASYRKQSKPAQAIADLQSALWLKNGLGEAERADALTQRAAAYREAGLSDQTDGSPAKQAQTKAAPAAPVTPAPVAAAVTKPAAVPAPAAAVVAKPVVAPPAPAPVKVADVASAPPKAAPAAMADSSSSGVGGFFSNLFGGSSPAPASPPPPAPPATQTSAWSNQVQVAPATPAATAPRTTATLAAPKPAATAPATAPRPAAGPAPASAAAPARAVETAAAERPADPYAVHARPAAAKYQLQVAAVRTREEAQAIATRIRMQHAKEPGIREAVIDEATVGSMGTFYRVRLGPYAEANEPRTLCTKLRGAGVDCMLVTP